MPAPERLDRRAFLARAATAAAAMGLAACGARAPTCGTADRLRDRALTCLDAVLDSLLPGDAGAPGARDVRAAAYVDAALAHDVLSAEDCAALRAGLAYLEDRGFAALSPADREALLTAWLPTREGRAFFRPTMSLALEAWLGDPVHGGNPDGRVWAWLGHTPGFPRPPAEAG